MELDELEDFRDELDRPEELDDARGRADTLDDCADFDEPDDFDEEEPLRELDGMALPFESGSKRGGTSRRSDRSRQTPHAEECHRQPDGSDLIPLADCSRTTENALRSGSSMLSMPF